jgi:Au+-exporting ATPase
MAHTEKASGAAAPMVELAISGMTCSGCAQAVERVLSRLPGVAQVRVELASARAWISGSAPANALITAVKGAGYDAELVQHSTARSQAAPPG